MSKVFLHVGCGPLNKEFTTAVFKTDEWSEVRFDIDETVKPDYIGTMTDMSVLESNSFDAIYSSHNIEHLFFHEVPIAMKEFHRVLKDDGFLYLRCPDLQTLGQYLADDKVHEPLYTSGLGPIATLDILYGLRSDLKKGKHFMAHKTGFTARLLYGFFADAGFKSHGVARRTEAYELYGYAVKNKEISNQEIAEELEKHSEVNVL